MCITSLMRRSDPPSAATSAPNSNPASTTNPSASNSGTSPVNNASTQSPKCTSVAPSVPYSSYPIHRLPNRLLIHRRQHHIINIEMETNNLRELRLWKPDKHTVPAGTEQVRLDHTGPDRGVSEKGLSISLCPEERLLRGSAVLG